MATVKNTVLFIFAMIVLYGMFIPNTWPRAAAVVGVMLTATILSPLLLRMLHPEVFRFAAPLLTFEIVSENLLMLAIGSWRHGCSMHRTSSTGPRVQQGVRRPARSTNTG